jgi:phosphoribosylformimino-5-aminoimidazole carboxamide ribonucleotide (ProFAR) isomerase
MRIGSTVLLCEQQCIQSYEWKIKRPFGKLQGVIDSLEEYHCDEVAIIRPVRDNDSFDYFRKDIEIVKKLSSMTPISFGGGVRTLEYLKLLQGLPIERLIFSSAFLDKNEKLIMAAKDLFGHQAIQCLLPVTIKNGEALVFNSSKSGYIPMESIDTQFINELANEVILFDTEHEGMNNSFDWSLLEKIPFSNNKLIVSGGIGRNDIIKGRTNGIASVLVDNKILHQEYSISGYKHATKLS